MENQVRFHKLSGNGNDFVILDDPKIPLSAENIQRMCDRHFGIGADGVLVIRPLQDFDVRMQIFNADGGEAEMCGNGIRCVATYLNMIKKINQDSFLIKTMNGSYEVVRKDGAFAVEMSEIRDQDIYDLSTLNDFSDVFYVNTGVPHLIFLVNDLKRLDVKSLAPQYRYHRLFPHGTNVSFVQILEEKTAFVRTYERGVEDETYSCGTGLTACGLALNKWKGWEGAITLKTLGGIQKVSIGEKVYYSGEVNFCFAGEYSL